ncbi:MAG TPA: tetratricopeptide repeat protein, partial [Candidatus Brocadiales bacterium]|nr:tetratricopeptide repeat protein [Candidatus Brocadiales bacterium]
MSLINEALNKSRDDKVTVQENVPLGAGASGAQSTEYKGRKGVKKRKTSVLSISILGTILACSIGFYFVSNFTGLIPQFNGGKDVEIQLKDNMDFALHEKVIEAAPVPPESIQDMVKAESQPEVQADDLAKPVPSVATDVAQPTQEVISPVEVQTVESSEAGPLQISPEQPQNNDEWYAAYHFGMGVFHQKNKEIEKAVEEYNKVIKLDPDNAEVHINFGVIYKEEGDLNKAVEEYKKALAIDPWLDAGYNNLGVVYFLKGNYAESIKHYQKAVEINPENLESYINLGIAYGIQKRSDEALRAFQTAISINPRHAETHYNLAV